MDSRREQVFVGLFVLVATALLIVTVLTLTGTTGRGTVSHRAYFKFAAGLQSGAIVRYGGMKAGRVDQVRVDPNDSTRIEFTFRVRPEIPVKEDSTAKISSLGALGDNYVEITPGSPQSPLAPPGSTLKSAEYVGLDEVEAKINDLFPSAESALKSLNQRLDELQVTIARVNDLLNDSNRANIAATMNDVKGMLEENRPKLSSTMSNLEAVSAKAKPLIDDFKKTIQDADAALNHVDATLLENRADLRKSVEELRQTLTGASALVDQLNRTVNYNSDNIDETLENIRISTDNLRELTDTIKRRPSTLVRGIKVKERKPGGGGNE
ncbi:MAG TPA: MlaD family protein [Terriglobia bacterium]|nr:MlaD family protein [Terriglobia bacterium]